MKFEIIRSGSKSKSKPKVAKDRIKWPFSDMEIGDKVVIPEKLKSRAQVYAHVYGRQSEKKFKTKVYEGGVMVERVEFERE